MNTASSRGTQEPTAYCALVVGQHVACVCNNVGFDGTLHPPATINQLRGRGYTLPEVGTVYTVRDVCAFECGVTVRLAEIKNPPEAYRGRIVEGAYPHFWFRPLPRLRVEDFTNIAAPADTVVA